ncbi:MAG: hypothetical protein K9I85_11125 [Saprospiraceae bacterium]|nr:hypothetical protein [Saprospiraceae bacterium]
MKTKHIFLLLIGFGFSTVSVTAQTCAPSIDQAQFRQRQRIHQGIHQGDLTRQEARQLKGQQMHIHKMKHQARKDGHMSFDEKARIRHAQKKANRNIARKKHNHRNRY